jgi:hypothetical protein
MLSLSLNLYRSFERSGVKTKILRNARLVNTKSTNDEIITPLSFSNFRRIELMYSAIKALDGTTTLRLLILLRENHELSKISQRLLARI